MRGGYMNKISAVFALLLLLLFPVAASAEVRVISANGTDITKDNFEGSDSNFSEASHETQINNTGEKEGNDEGALKAIQTAFENALNGFTYTIIDQLVGDSASILSVDAESNASSDDRTLSFSINPTQIDPYEPDFVRKVQLPTGGLYLIGVFFTILGSYLMRLIYEKYPVQFSEFRIMLTGEEKPYNNDTIFTASVIAMVLWICYILLVYFIVGFRNLTVAYTSPTGIIIPDVYAATIPTYLLTGIFSYSSAFESAIGLYGIYTFTTLIFVAGIISEAILILGASGLFWKFNIIYWGMFALFNFIDIINICAISTGVSLYISTGNSIFVTVGLVAAVLGISVLIAIIIVYAVFKGRKIATGV